MNKVKAILNGYCYKYFIHLKVTCSINQNFLSIASIELVKVTRFPFHIITLDFNRKYSAILPISYFTFIFIVLKTNYERDFNRTNNSKN